MTSSQFLGSILNAVTDHIVVIDGTGSIVLANHAWVSFGVRNSCLSGTSWRGVNYLKVCDASAEMGDTFGEEAAGGIRQVIGRVRDDFYFEYPCHSPDKKRWFMMRVTSFVYQEKRYYVIAHQNITERKLAEEKVEALSRIDGLTNIPNRRNFDEFLHNEWRRCARLGLPITLVLIDLDHFKLLNDHYGHHVGDDCLKQIGSILLRFARRPGDLCARYGGEEFAVVFGNTDSKEASIMVDNLLEEIRELRIPNVMSPVLPVVTASAGLMTMYPDRQNEGDVLIAGADTLLYMAKENGRNRVVCNESLS
ncbi:MAG: sensor domain-containing diguanylate cyclase [Desulfopila sp.]|jgi:diguanylate cyclase (GGDEF)-like protein|nr:sensor domain-containing diguanylate cyclase [Desulfopila sp.]